MQQSTKKSRSTLPSEQKTKNLTKVQQKLSPSQLLQKQLSGQIFEDQNQQPKIIQFQNLADYSIYTTSAVSVDEPLFEPIPSIIQFTDYEPLQIKEKIFKLRNKDKVARRVKIFKPDSRLFQVVPLGANGKEANPDKAVNSFGGTKVAPGMETNFIIRFSPEAKADYNYDIVVETEREKFIVPIISVGKRAMIDFPDVLDFGNCPVKYATEKPVIIRNLGEKTTKWFLKLPVGFDADKKEGILEFGKNEQIVIKFYPSEAKTYKNEAILNYDNMDAYVGIMGIAHNGNVYLSKSYIQMDDAYIGLQTQQTLQIINKSNVKANFEWRAFSTEKEEQEKKNRLRNQLEEEEQEERMLIKELVTNEQVNQEYDLEENEDSDEEERDEKAILQKKQKKAELMLARKYKNIRKAIEDDLLLFQDDIFSIEPVSGCIWPNSEMTITVTFVPKGALHYSTIAYCNISCSEERLALNLSGEGIGPKAFLSVYEVNLGDVFVNEIHRTEVVIENRGEIECRFELLQNERAFGKMFKFDTDKGNLGVGQRVPFTITFQSSIPGEFKETFRWRLEGSTDQLTILFIGHVIAPTFHFDVERISFGSVSYSFQYTEKIKLTNTSTVAFTYNLRIPGDGKLSSKEFEIDAQRDTIQAKKSKEIFVTFIPKSTKAYEMVMVVDIDGVGQDMLSIPITGLAQVPKVEIKPSDRLDFGEIFLRNPDTMGIQLINNSDLKAKYQVMPQNDEYKVLATYKVEPESGIIEKNSATHIQVTLTTKKLGDITLPLSVNIIGSNNGLPHVINIVASSTGPKVEVGTKELDFKDVNVLQDYSQKISITNKSKIQADFHAFTKNKVSIFKPIQKHGVLEPSESMEIEIVCCADDAIKFSDILHFVIKEGVDVDVVLKARGVGTTLFCKEDLTFITFGTQYTHRKITKEIFVENKGRKPQKLAWTFKSEKEKKNEEEPPKKDSKGKPATAVEEEQNVFQIVPDNVTLPPKHGIMFQFRALSTRLGKIPEQYILTSVIGQERKSSILYVATVEGDFIKPTLIFSERKLHFKYSWERNIPFMPISRNLELTCASQLPVNFTLKCQPPFSINQDQFSLLPGKVAQVRVDFDPGYKTDRRNGEIEGKLIISHIDHPHRDQIDLVGSLNFPNITLDTNLINFGSILNDTTKKMILFMRNVSEMRIDYEWTFVQEEFMQPPGTSQSNAIGFSRDSMRLNNKSVPINEIFDILPLSGALEPGSEEQVEFVYNAMGGQRFKTQAICHVDGGPEYEVNLLGDSSLISYRLSTNLIELGDVRFCEWVTREFSIDNTGKVTFEYKVSLANVKKKGYVEVTPMQGRVGGGEKQKLQVRVSPVLPAEFKEVILVSIGYYEPEPITIIGKGVYPSILMNVQRTENILFSSKFDQEIAKRKTEFDAQQKRAQLLIKAQQSEGKKQNATGRTFEQVQAEVERDIDRFVFCELIKKALLDREQDVLLENNHELVAQGSNILQNQRSQSAVLPKLPGDVKLENDPNKIYEKIYLASYICDFGNVVINSVRNKTIKVSNPGSLPVDFYLDRKHYQNDGYTIQPEKVNNLPPGEETTLTITYQTKKKMKFGHTKTVVPMEVKKGSKYFIELHANITIPQIKFENIIDTIDFGKVLIGQRMTFSIRLINDKEINCEWSQSQRTELAQGEKKEDPRFTLTPNNGCVQPGQKQLVEVWFTPTFEKTYQQKFTLIIKENSMPFVLNVKGQGVAINLEHRPPLISIGPVLPYKEFAYAVLEVHNPSDYDTELINLEFDTQFLQDEEMMNVYPPLEHNDSVLMQVRQPGDRIWEDVQKQFKLRKVRDSLIQRIANPIVTEEERLHLQKELDEIRLSSSQVRVEYPPKVEQNLLRHIMVMGTPTCGKTSLCNQLASFHRRKVVNLNELVEWCRDNNTQGYRKFEAYQNERQGEIRNIEQEREKLLKKAGKKSKELEDKWGPIPVELYEMISEDVLKALISDRMNHPDCNAGVVFDNLQSRYWPDELYLLKCILGAIGDQGFQLFLMNFQQDSSGLEVCKVIEWEGMESLGIKEEEQTLVLEQSIEQGRDKKKEIKKIKELKKSSKKIEKDDKKKDDKKKDDKKVDDKKKVDKKNDDKKVEQKIKEKPIQIEIEEEKELNLYDVFYPGQWGDDILKQRFSEVTQKMKDLLSSSYKSKIELPKINDPVFEDLKAEQKQVIKPVKKGEKVEEEIQVQEIEIDYSQILQGERIITQIPIHFYLPQLFRTAFQHIPSPIYPDPNILPVPDPFYQQICTRVKKNIPFDRQSSTISPQRGNKNQQPTESQKAVLQEKANQLVILEQNTLKYFQIFTPKDPYLTINQKTDPDESKQNIVVDARPLSKLSKKSVPADAVEEVEQNKEQNNEQNKDLKVKVKSKVVVKREDRKKTQQVEEELVQKEQQPKFVYTRDQLEEGKSRWIIPQGRTLILVIRFFAKTTGQFEGRLNFENFFGTKRIAVDIHGISDFPQVSTLPKSIFWQVKKMRPIEAPLCYLSKVYVQSENNFEFGPLLVGKNPHDKLQPGYKITNSVTFRISNQGKFDGSVQFALLSSVTDEPGYKKGIFELEQESTSLPVNSLPMELRIWAFPDSPQRFKDDLIVMIKDNPLPLIIPLICYGCRPIIDILGEGGDLVKFDKLLINQTGQRVVVIRNNGMIPAKWRLSGIDTVQDELTVTNTSGELQPTQEAKIEVKFKAIRERKITHKLALEVEDVENMSIRQDAKHISLEAEGFDISVELKFPDVNVENLLDFGSVRVGDFADRTFSVKNTGLYRVKFSFVMKKKATREMFRVEPMDVELEPNQVREVLVRFIATREMKLKTTNSNTDIVMEVLEGKTLELYKPVPINVQFNSVYSKYSVVPLKNINFGPIQFNESKSRTLEVRNEGQFEFTFTLFDFLNEEFRKQLQQSQEKERQEKVIQQQTLPVLGTVDPKKGAKKEAKVEKVAAVAKPGKGGKGEIPSNQLKIGQWTITPNTGVVAPDSSATVEIVFQGAGQKNYEQRMALEISGRDPADEPAGIPYEVIAESCIPGINVDNFESIFEEQVVVQSQSTGQNITSLINSNVFFIEEKVFHFGTLVPSKVPDGIIERFKLSNPNKVPCNVKLDVRRRNTNNLNENFAFEIQPKNIKIAPHESTYVKVAFKPTIMAQYFGVFEAIVENGEQNPRTHKLLFDLRGEGALPTLKLEQPKEWLDERTPVLRFGKVRVGKTIIMPVVLKNDGQVPSTVKWDVLTTNEHFKFLDSQTQTLTPKTSATFNIEFSPRDPGQKQWYLTMSTVLNPYEITKIAMMGEAYFEEIVFEKLPDDLEDQVLFGDCIINVEKRVSFLLRNNGSNLIRFQWNTQSFDEFSFTPRQGHLAPQSSKQIQLTFKSPKSINHQKLQLLCETKVVKQSAASFLDWDDSMTTQRYVTLTEYNWIMRRREEDESRRKEEESNNAAMSKKGVKKEVKKASKGQEEVRKDVPPPSDPNEEANIPLSDPILEPDHSVVEKTEKNVILRTTATADFARYEVDSKSVLFKPTLMYTTRNHQIKLRNTSLIALKYNCKIVSADTGAIDPGYFYVNPKIGTISSNCDEVFMLKFSPTEVLGSNERLMVVQIDNLDPNLEKLIIELDADAERPICHFELPPNKYREKKPDLDSKYGVIEFESLGCKVKNTRRFYVVNPTATGYEFEWKRLDDDKQPMGANTAHANYFKCITPKGVVLSGKKQEMVFEYNPDQAGTHESYWQFTIPTEKVIQFFVAAGTVVEPKITFGVGKVNFGPLLVQGKNRETIFLKNLEDVPIPFQFERESVRGDPDYADSLIVLPMSGTVKAFGDFPIEILFAPKVEREYNYNLVCNVKRRDRPVTLNVKGIGYVLHHSVQVQSTIVQPGASASLDFGEIYINEKRVRAITIENKGDFNFDFSVRRHPSLTSFLNVLPENGTVRRNDRFVIELVFQPLAPCRLNGANNTVSLSIVSGPTYTFILNGSAKKPGVDFSFVNFDFGPCFVLKQPLPIIKVLELRNRDQSAMAIETQFERQPYFDVQLASGQVILPLQIETTKDKKGLIQIKELNVLRIPVIFTPRECINYDETVIFDINGLHKTEVCFKGQGTTLKLELERSEDQNVDFGVLGMGLTSSRSVFLVNMSAKAISVSLDIESQLKDLKQKSFLKIRPKGTFTVNPRERKEITLVFKPTQRLHGFKKELYLKISDNNEVRKILNVAGACHGIELKLVEDTVGFGAVVLNSKLTKSVQLANLGDIGAKFAWETGLCKNYFTISPETGSIPAHEDVYFDITFHPNVIDNDIRFNKVKCSIQGSDPLYINLLGKCIDQPRDSIQELRFETVVRTPTVKKVTIKNPTQKAWRVKTTVSALLPQFREYFEGKEYIEIPANGQADYEVIYKPLTMTKSVQIPDIKEEQHEGTLFFPLPDGQAILYNLFGKSLPPNPAQIFDINIKAKKTHIHILPLKNWLKATQRFAIQWTMEPEDPSIIFNGANTFDVSGEGSKDYKLTIYGLKPCVNKLTIFFRNQQTREFVFFRVNLTLQPPEPLSKIEMSSIVREVATKLITIENPLNVAIEIKKEQLISDSENIGFNPPSFSIPARSEFGFEVIFRPLLAAETNAKITLKSLELGEFIYPLKLMGLPANSMRTLFFKTALGSDMVLPFKLVNYTKKPTVYQCVVTKLGPNGKPIQVVIDPKAKGPAASIGQTDFMPETPQAQAAGTENIDGVEVQVGVKYEPSSLSETRAVLVLISADGGEYQCLLVGQGKPPQPKGPFKLSGAKPPTIDFKNPFFEAQEFTIRIDNPSFTTSTKSPVKIDGKKVINIAVVYKVVPGGSNNGRLIIQCGDLPQWVFYLQGE